jgi:hypothetical protein
MYQIKAVVGVLELSISCSGADLILELNGESQIIGIVVTPLVEVLLALADSVSPQFPVPTSTPPPAYELSELQGHVASKFLPRVPNCVSICRTFLGK